MSGSFLSIDWQDDAGTDQSLDIDCSVSERYTSVGEPTEHAVETGANIADHVRPHNDTFTFECLISSTPIESPSFGMDGASGSVQGMTVTVGGQQFTANTWQFNQSFNRVFNCDQQIRQLIKAATLVTMTTGVRAIDNCVITQFEWNRDASTGNDLAFTIDVAQLRIATSQRVAVAAPRQRRGQQQQNRGAQPAVQDNRSLAARIADSDFARQFLGGG